MAKETEVGIQHCVVLRFAVNIVITRTNLGYDALLFEMSDLVKESGLPTLDEFKKHCTYIRDIKSLDKQKYIVYEIRNSNRIQSVQRV